MADLPTIADRMNDTEITANAPVTETLMRRLGSNINFLLDFLGVSDGATAPAGSLSDLTQAIDLIDGHTMDLQATLSSSGVTNVGTFTKTKYVNQMFYIFHTSTAGFPISKTITQVQNPVGTDITPLLNIDGGGNQEMHNSFPLGNDDINQYVKGETTDNGRLFSKIINDGVQFAANSTTDALIPFAVADWRDVTTSFDFLVNMGNGLPASGDTIQVYRKYYLDIGSLGF